MGRHWLIPLLIVVAVIVFSSHGLKGGPEISVKDAATLIKNEPRLVIVDVRERADYEQGHIASAISLPSADFKARLDSLKLPKYEALILYSTDDTQARDATKHLYENGYQGALTLKGGFDAWRAAGMGLVKPRQP